MFPVRDDNPGVLRPLTTYILIGLNALMWLGVQGLGTDPALARSICTLGLIPGDLLQTLPAGTRIPISETAACVITSDPAWHTAVTSMFLHGGWFHIAGNLWFLWVFGDNVEDAMGHARFAAFYLLCGLGAAALQVISDPASGAPMVGASGAIGGVMGAYIVLYPRVHVHMLVIFGFFITTIAVPAVLMLGYWLALQVLGGLGLGGGGVAFWAHVGGFASGAVLVWPFRDRALLERHPYHGWRKQPLPSQAWHSLRR